MDGMRRIIAHLQACLKGDRDHLGDADIVRRPLVAGMLTVL
jgi:hypothetical protein